MHRELRSPKSQGFQLNELPSLIVAKSRDNGPRESWHTSIPFFLP